MSTTTQNCIFCKIVAKISDADILYEDENVLVFRDIKPAAKHHVLAIPKKHIRNAAALTKNDQALLESLKSAGLCVIEQLGGDKDDISLGFHWPPFNSVSHLHLHVISPKSEMGFISSLAFKANTWWYSSFDYVCNEYIKNKL